MPRRKSEPVNIEIVEDDMDFEEEEKEPEPVEKK